MNNKSALWLFVALFAVLMSVPWLVPHTGWLILIGFLPLLLADDMADHIGVKHFWIWHYSAFVLWNAFTTFWVAGATVGGAVFAILANAFQMSLIWGVFRFSKKRLDGALPYIFLAVMWIAWEKAYFGFQISWPWLVLGNAFARTTHLVQWYSVTGSLGGSLWVWVVNLGLFGLLSALSEGRWNVWNRIARFVAAGATALILAGPIVCSLIMYHSYDERSEGKMDVLIGQPNFDPYEKFKSLTQAEQNGVLLELYANAIDGDTDLLLAPETFTGDVYLDNPEASPTLRIFSDFLSYHPNTSLLMGASTYNIYVQHSSPSILARPYGDSAWLESHNSALMVDAAGLQDVYRKSKLVVGTELTPFPKVFVPLDNWLSRKMGVSGLMGRCIGQEEASVLNAGDVPVGCAVCYESVYGEYCTEFVKKGAKLMTVITNDAWWGNMPGYKQHMSYSRLRAIELRRDIARCGNTGISAFIDQKGDVVDATPWWVRTTLKGEVNLNSEESFFVRNGDIPGRICVLAFLLLAALLVVRCFVKK